MKIYIRIINFWPINKWFDLGVDPEPEDQSVFKDVEAQFWLVMRLWVLIMLVGFAFGFWLLFCKPETVDPKIKKAHEEHIEKVKKARREAMEQSAEDTETGTLLRRRNVQQGEGDEATVPLF